MRRLKTAENSSKAERVGQLLLNAYVLAKQIYGFPVTWGEHITDLEKSISKLRNFGQGHGQQLMSCNKLLDNLTKGAWERLPGSNISAFDETYQRYWRQKKIATKLWRDDRKCGYDNLLPKMADSKWPTVGSWCDKDGDAPCCNNVRDGICRKPSKLTCDCEGCVDTRKFVYAELSKWKTSDPRCSWTHHNASQACDVIHKSSYNNLHFVGDSLMRNMFSAFVMLLSDDTVRGSWSTRMTERQKDLCVAERFFFWDECRQIVRKFDDMLYKEKLCGGVKPSFTAVADGFYNLKHNGSFRQMVKKMSGKEGTLLMVGIGMHMQLQADIVINQYLDPAVRVRNNFYENTNASPDTQWPRIFFMLPLLTGLLKPARHIDTQSNAVTEKFAQEMRVYCGKHHIPVFDFRQLTRYVHSFDGSHYGLGVNLMKNQVMLNYIAQQTLKESI